VGLNAALLREMIEDAGMEPDLKHRALKRLDALGRETDRLRDILEDFLQYAGRMNLSATPIDLAKLLQELDDFFHPQCDQADVRFELEVPSEPVTIHADAALLKQALLNLMLNAVQVLDGQEGATLRLRLSTEDASVNVRVEDNGPGIEPDRLETIFRPYWSSRAGGTGLGLPVTRRIVEAHHGEISVQSTHGEGTRFDIVLPNTPPSDEETERSTF
jgi:signal transduction histidine kinase